MAPVILRGQKVRPIGESEGGGDEGPELGKWRCREGPWRAEGHAEAGGQGAQETIICSFPGLDFSPTPSWPPGGGVERGNATESFQGCLWRAGYQEAGGGGGRALRSC